jgi:Arc/MetJ-type ribon-helix-helix transcriptional regulator
MRTTVVIPDETVAEIRERIGSGSLSGFVRTALEERLAALRREALLGEMAAGYAAEVREPSLDAAWSEVETDGLP